MKSTGKTLLITTGALGGAVGVGYLIVRSRRTTDNDPITDSQHTSAEATHDAPGPGQPGRQVKPAQATHDAPGPSRPSAPNEPAPASDSKPAPEPQPAFHAAVYPLPRLPDGRNPRITSHHKTRNPSRATHNGVDWFYRTKPNDPVWKLGDGGGTTNKKWIVPPGTPAIAVADGVVQIAGNTPTGWRVWIDHGGWRSGYFHLTELFVKKGERITTGRQLGIVGDNPRDHDARHLHFELSASNRYQPIDPVPFLTRADPLPLHRTQGPIRRIEGIRLHGV